MNVRKLAASIAAALLVAIFVMVPAQLLAPQAAQAFAGCYPPSTINPACQPLNTPILLESGVLSGSGTGTGTTMIAGGGAGSVAPLTINAGAGVVVGATGVTIAIGLGGPEGRGYATAGGIKDAKIDRDPNWPGVGGAGCTVVQMATAIFSSGSLGTTPLTDPLRTNTCMPGEAFNLRYASNTIAGRWAERLMTLTEDATAVHITLAPHTANTCSTSCTLQIRTVCDAATRVLGTLYTYTSASSSQTVNLTMPKACPSGATLTALYVTTNPYGTGETYNTVIWNPANSAPRDGTSLTGQIRTTLTCKPHDGGSTFEVSVPVSIYGLTLGSDLAIPDAACPEGSLMWDGKVEWKAPTDPGWSPIVEPITTPDVIKELPAQYPACYPTPAEGPCALTLWQVKPGGGLDSCGTNAELCSGWAQSPNANDLYECYFGPYPVDLNKCSAFRRPDIGPLPNTYPDGGTIPYTAPPPTPLPNPIKDPDTGVPVPIPTVPIPLTPDQEQQNQQCFPSGWGALNPVSWVVMPVQCALKWAFVPRNSVVQQHTNTIRQAWSATAPARIITAVSSWSFLPPPGGCDGITISLFFLPQPMQIASACPGDMLAGLAGWSRLFGNVTFTIYGVVAVTRNLARIVEFPGLGGDR